MGPRKIGQYLELWSFPLEAVQLYASPSLLANAQDPMSAAVWGQGSVSMTRSQEEATYLSFPYNQLSHHTVSSNSLLHRLVQCSLQYRGPVKQRPVGIKVENLIIAKRIQGQELVARSRNGVVAFFVFSLHAGTVNRPGYIKGMLGRSCTRWHLVQAKANSGQHGLKLDVQDLIISSAPDSTVNLPLSSLYLLACKYRPERHDLRFIVL